MLFEQNNKMDKSLAKLTKEKREETYVNKTEMEEELPTSQIYCTEDHTRML